METTFHQFAHEMDPGMSEDTEALTLLRGISERLVLIETLVEVNLGKDGTVPELKKQVERVNGKIILATGIATGVLFAWEQAKGFLFGK